METRPGTRQESKLREGRGSGPGVRKRRSDALGAASSTIGAEFYDRRGTYCDRADRISTGSALQIEKA